MRFWNLSFISYHSLCFCYFHLSIYLKKVHFKNIRSNSTILSSNFIEMHINVVLFKLFMHRNMFVLCMHLQFALCNIFVDRFQCKIIHICYMVHYTNTNWLLQLTIYFAFSSLDEVFDVWKNGCSVAFVFTFIINPVYFCWNIC